MFKNPFVTPPPKDGALSLLSKFLQRNGKELVGLGVSIYALFWLLKRLDPLKQVKDEAREQAEVILKELQKTRPKHTLRNVTLTAYECIIATDIVCPSNVENIISFDDIGGLEEVKAQLYESIILPLRRPELFQRGKLASTPKGVLLYGPPGTGKTMLAKAIAHRSESVFINLNVANITQKWLGESEKMIQATFSLAAKLSPSIIFIDEIDSLFRKRSSEEHEVSTRIKAMFMSLWDGLSTINQITVIGATNRPYDLDEAILRRMPNTFHVGLPNTSQREHILKIILRDEPLEPNFNYARLATETEGYSGSDLQALCQHAARAPVRQLLLDQNSDLAEDSTIELRFIAFNDFIESKKVVMKTGKASEMYKQATESVSLPQFVQNLQQQFQHHPQSPNFTVNLNFGSNHPILPENLSRLEEEDEDE